MTLRRDHVAGGVFVAVGAMVVAASGDLPFGSLASPGAGMLPILLAVLMMAFGVTVLAGAGRSPRLAELDWTDFPHALRVMGLAAAAAALYVPLGFALTIPLLLFALTFIVERRPLLPAVAFSVGAAAAAHVLFNILLRTPLPRGLIWF